MSAREDRQDIADVLIRYATCIDSREWTQFATVFTTDCVLDYGEIGTWNGIDAVAEFMEQVHVSASHTLHRLSNTVVAVDGDTAQSRVYVDAYILVGDKGAGVNATGFYDDLLIRTGDGWRIVRRTFTSVRVAAVDGA